jgi:hypothetical protein
MDSLSTDFLYALSGHTLAEQMVATSRRVREHRAARSSYPCTDRELNVLALLVAQQELGEAPGEFRFPGGATVTISGDPSNETSYQIVGQALPADFPREVRDFITRLPVEQQPERDALLLTGPTETQIQEALHRHKIEVRKRSLEAKAGGIRLVANNRRNLGLPPLEEEQELEALEREIAELEEELEELEVVWG